METVIPTGKDFINTRGYYKECEEKNDGNWSRNNAQGNTWIIKDMRNYSIAVLLPVFLALCFLITMLGAVFLFTSLFLLTKFNVMEIFVNECVSSLIVLIFFTNGLHLIVIGLTGVLGLGRRRWLLIMHAVLAVSALLGMISSYYYEPRYESSVMDEIETNMLSSLAKNRFKHHTGWEYIQRHMQCCGVNSYTDWCGCRNSSFNTEKISIHSPLKTPRSVEKRSFSAPNMGFSEAKHTQSSIRGKFLTSEDLLPSAKVEASTAEFSSSSANTELHSKNQEISAKYRPLFPGDEYEEYNDALSSTETQSQRLNTDNNRTLLHFKKRDSSEQSLFVIKRINEHNTNLSAFQPIPFNEYESAAMEDPGKTQSDHQKEHTIIECYIPQSCCKMNSAFPYDIPDRRCMTAKDTAGLNSRGCRDAVNNIARRFISSFMSMCKFIIMVMILDLPLVLLMISI